jgi:hypothetical protein
LIEVTSCTFLISRGRATAIRSVKSRKQAKRISHSRKGCADAQHIGRFAAFRLEEIVCRGEEHQRQKEDCQNE